MAHIRVRPFWLLASLAVAFTTSPVPLAVADSPRGADDLPASALVRVGIYDHSSGTAKGPKSLRRFLNEEAGFECHKLSPEDIRDGKLAGVDVLIMPGGSGSKQSAMLEQSGRDAVCDFVRDGGGYVGICAGSYLASAHYSWSLHLINAQVVDREHWARGTGTCTLILTEAGKQTLREAEDEVDVYYGQGPLLAPLDKTELPGYETLAEYGTEIAKKGAPSGVMVGTTAIARAPYGAGRVICFSPHPERLSGPNHLMSYGVRWAAGVDTAALSPPDSDSHVIPETTRVIPETLATETRPENKNRIEDRNRTEEGDSK